MNYGRINERNTGRHKLDGGCKRAKAVQEPELTDLQIKAKEAVMYCNRILNDGIKLHDNVPELVQHWINNGIVEVKEIENPWGYARLVFPTIKMAYLIESHRKDIELIKGLLIECYKI